ncbi:MAG: DUF5615 family PIN-like protein [Hyphomicrobiales bacterium]
MHLIIDENVPDSVASFLKDRGHHVELVRERFGQMTPDEFIAWVGDEQGAIVVTLDRDFRRLVERVPSGGKAKFRSLGRISLRCKEPRALARMREFIEDIEREHERAQLRPVRRMIVEITETTFTVIR